MELPLDLLRTIAAAVDEGTLDGAARRLGITPSAVSQRIKAIEQRTGRIVLRRTKPVRATDEGEPLLRLARQLSLLEHDALQAMHEHAPHTRVALAVNADSLATWLLPALAPVVAAHRVSFEFVRADQDDTAALLESGAVVGAITSRRSAVSGCVATPLGAERYTPVASADMVGTWFPHGADAASLAAAPVVDFGRDDDMQASFVASLGIAPFGPRHIVPGSAEMADAVRLGYGWAFVLPGQFEQDVADGRLVVVSDRTVDVPLVWQRWNLVSPLMDAITDALVAGARTRLHHGGRTTTA